MGQEETVPDSVIIKEITDVDSALKVAIKWEYTDSTRNQSIELCKKILIKSPTYTDVTVVLARDYYWNGQVDSALQILTDLLENKPYEDAYISICDIERWEGNYQSSMEYASKGLEHFPDSEDLMIRKAHALYNLKFKDDAISNLDTLLKHNPKNEEAKKLEDFIKNPVDSV